MVWRWRGSEGVERVGRGVGELRLLLCPDRWVGQGDEGFLERARPAEVHRRMRHWSVFQGSAQGGSLGVQNVPLLERRWSLAGRQEGGRGPVLVFWAVVGFYLLSRLWRNSLFIIIKIKIHYFYFMFTTFGLNSCLRSPIAYLSKRSCVIGHPHLRTWVIGTGLWPLWLAWRWLPQALQLLLQVLHTFYAPGLVTVPSGWCGCIPAKAF